MDNKSLIIYEDMYDVLDYLRHTYEGKDGFKKDYKPTKHKA